MKYLLYFIILFFLPLKSASQNDTCSYYYKLDIFKNNEILNVKVGTHVFGDGDLKIKTELSQDYCKSEITFKIIRFYSNTIVSEGQYVIYPDTLKAAVGVYELIPPFHKKFQTLNYFQGLRDGIWKYYDDEGKLIKIEKYFKDNLIEYNEY